nr:dynamin-related protein 3A-like [Ipomoea batatas]
MQRWRCRCRSGVARQQQLRGSLRSRLRRASFVRQRCRSMSSSGDEQASSGGVDLRLLAAVSELRAAAIYSSGDGVTLAPVANLWQRQYVSREQYLCLLGHQSSNLSRVYPCLAPISGPTNLKVLQISSSKDVDPCEDLTDEDIRTAIQNATQSEARDSVSTINSSLSVSPSLVSLFQPSIDLRLTITTGVASYSLSSADLRLTITAGVTSYSPSPVDLRLTITVRRGSSHGRRGCSSSGVDFFSVVCRLYSVRRGGEHSRRGCAAVALSGEGVAETGRPPRRPVAEEADSVLPRRGRAPPNA